MILIGSGGKTYAGTANQVIVTGTVLSLPQDIGTTSDVQFGQTLVRAASGVSLIAQKASAGVTESIFKVLQDNGANGIDIYSDANRFTSLAVQAGNGGTGIVLINTYQSSYIWNDNFLNGGGLSVGTTVTSGFGLSVAGAISGSAYFDGFVQINGPLSVGYINSDLVTNSIPTTGQTVTATITKANELLYVTPAGTLAALTITLPASANARTGQIIRIFITQIVVALTVNTTGGGTILGSLPDTSSPNSTFAYECVSTSGAGTWVMIYSQ